MKPGDKGLALLGLCKKAGALLTGTEAVLDGVRSGRVKLVVIASDVSENTQKKITDKCVFYKTNYEISEYSREILGFAVGSGQLSAVAITDGSFYAGYRKSRCGNGDIER